MNTKDWTMGHYPTKKKKPLSIEETLQRLEEFNHKSDTKRLREEISRLTEAVSLRDATIEKITELAFDRAELLADRGLYSHYVKQSKLLDALGLLVEDEEEDY